MSKQNSPKVNKLIHAIDKDEIDLCADMDQQPLNFANYVSSFNDYCVNCEKQPCACHLIHTV